MPDLGKYAVSVLSAYGVSLVVLAGLVWMTLAQGRKVRSEMQEVEQRTGRDGTR